MLSKSIELDLDLINCNNKDDIIINMLYESIDNPDNMSVLYESALSYDANKSYHILVESIDEYHNLKKEASDASDDSEKQLKFLGKCKRVVKNAFNWWYKEDPYKKHKTLRLILKLAIEVTILVIAIKLPGSGKLADKVLMTKAGNAARAISYKGTNKILRKLFNERAIVLAVIRNVYFSLLLWLRSLDNKAYKDINSKDIDKNIEMYDKSIDKLNDLIDKTDDPKEKEILKESKKNMEDSLAELMKIKNSPSKNKGYSQRYITFIVKLYVQTLL